jgi:hypothetical protein
VDDLIEQPGHPKWRFVSLLAPRAVDLALFDGVEGPERVTGERQESEALEMASSVVSASGDALALKRRYEPSSKVRALEMEPKLVKATNDARLVSTSRLHRSAAASLPLRSDAAVADGALQPRWVMLGGRGGVEALYSTLAMVMRRGTGKDDLRGMVVVGQAGRLVPVAYLRRGQTGHRWSGDLTPCRRR